MVISVTVNLNHTDVKRSYYDAQVERIQSAHASQVAELRVQVNSLRADNDNLMAQQQELYVHCYAVKIMLWLHVK